MEIIVVSGGDPRDVGIMHKIKIYLLRTKKVEPMKKKKKENCILLYQKRKLKEFDFPKKKEVGK